MVWVLNIIRNIPSHAQTLAEQTAVPSTAGCQLYALMVHVGGKNHEWPRA